MKTISISIILAYLLLPVVCVAYPFVLQSESTPGAFYFLASENPDKQEMDTGDSDSCCEDHTLFDNQKFNALPAVRLNGSHASFLIAQVFIPIFVPPQNKFCFFLCL